MHGLSSITDICTVHCANHHIIQLKTHFLNFSAYQVIVLKVVDGAEELPNDYPSKLKDINNANLNFHVAAEIKNVPVHEESWEFTVGDDETYGGYVNKGLETGQDYVIYQRALTHDKDVSEHKLIYSNFVNHD